MGRSDGLLKVITGTAHADGLDGRGAGLREDDVGAFEEVADDAAGQVDGEALVAQRAEVAGLGRHRADIGEGAGFGEIVGIDAVGDGEEDVGHALVGRAA